MAPRGELTAAPFRSKIVRMAVAQSNPTTQTSGGDGDEWLCANCGDPVDKENHVVIDGHVLCFECADSDDEDDDSDEDEDDDSDEDEEDFEDDDDDE
jgi:hypothetical protein